MVTGPIVSDIVPVAECCEGLDSRAELKQSSRKRSSARVGASGASALMADFHPLRHRGTALEGEGMAIFEMVFNLMGCNHLDPKTSL
jgi:hypothetical protein